MSDYYSKLKLKKDVGEGTLSIWVGIVAFMAICVSAWALYVHFYGPPITQEQQGMVNLFIGLFIGFGASMGFTVVCKDGWANDHIEQPGRSLHPIRNAALLTALGIIVLAGVIGVSGLQALWTHAKYMVFGAVAMFTFINPMVMEMYFGRRQKYQFYTELTKEFVHKSELEKQQKQIDALEKKLSELTASLNNNGQ